MCSPSAHQKNVPNSSVMVLEREKRWSAEPLLYRSVPGYCTWREQPTGVRGGTGARIWEYLCVVNTMGNLIMVWWSSWLRYLVHLNLYHGYKEGSVYATVALVVCSLISGNLKSAWLVVLSHADSPYTYDMPYLDNKLYARFMVCVGRHNTFQKGSELTLVIQCTFICWESQPSMDLWTRWNTLTVVQRNQRLQCHYQQCKQQQQNP